MNNITINLNLEQELEKANAEYNKRKEEVIEQARKMIANNIISHPKSVQIINDLIKLLEEEF